MRAYARIGPSVLLVFLLVVVVVLCNVGVTDAIGVSLCFDG